MKKRRNKQQGALCRAGWNRRNGLDIAHNAQQAFMITDLLYPYIVYYHSSFPSTLSKALYGFYFDLLALLGPQKWLRWCQSAGLPRKKKNFFALRSHACGRKCDIPSLALSQDILVEKWIKLLKWIFPRALQNLTWRYLCKWNVLFKTCICKELI